MPFLITVNIFYSMLKVQLNSIHNISSKFKNMDHAAFTPTKENNSAMASRIINSQSSHKVTKIFFNKQHECRKQQYVQIKKAPFVRVDILSENQPSLSNSNQKDFENLMRILEADHRDKNQQLASLQEKNQLKMNVIQELIERVQAKKKRNKYLRQHVMHSNQVKEQIWRQKNQDQKKIQELDYQAQSTLVLQQKEAILMNTEHQNKQKFISIKCEQIQNLRKENLSNTQIQKQKLQILNRDGQISQQKQNILNLLNKDIQKLMIEVNSSTFQLSILRMQINSRVRIGFSTVSIDPQADRKKFLQRNTISWPKNKVKHFSSNQLRDFLIIQLYPLWKKMLNKLSSDFVGYRTILCHPAQQHEEEKNLDLSLYLPRPSQINKHPTGSKTRTFLILYSHIPEHINEYLNVVMGLAGTDNGILKIYAVRMQPLQNGNNEIIIQYSFQGFEKVRKIQVVRLHELTRQAILACVPQKDDKTVMVKIQIPLIFNSAAERTQYEQVYDVLRRWK